MGGSRICRYEDFKRHPSQHPSTKAYMLLRSSSEHLFILVAKEPVSDLVPGKIVIAKHVSVSHRTRDSENKWKIAPPSDNDMRLVAEHFYGAGFPYVEVEPTLSARHLYEDKRSHDDRRAAAEADQAPRQLGQRDIADAG